MNIAPLERDRPVRVTLSLSPGAYGLLVAAHDEAPDVETAIMDALASVVTGFMEATTSSSVVPELFAPPPPTVVLN